MKRILSTIIGITMLCSINSQAWSSNFLPHKLFVQFKEKPNLIWPKYTKVKHLFHNWYVLDNVDYGYLTFLKQEPSVKHVLADQTSKSEFGLNIGKAHKSNYWVNLSDPSTTSFNDPLIYKQWALKNDSENGLSVLKAYENMNSKNKKSIIVAVIDTGVDITHEDLKDVIWTNTDEIPNNGIDDDNNGYIDDIHGINTLQRNTDGTPTTDISDPHGHGTHVSGIIGAKHNNGIGIIGIASMVKIMPIKTVPSNGDEKDSDVVDSLLYAAKNGAKIINCSFGKRENEGGMIVSETIDYIGREFGVLVVAAAGNSSVDIDQTPMYPASYENEHLLVIASTNSWGWPSFFTNYGLRNVDVAAPGSSIFSTMPNNKYASISGTSMASPAIAGLSAEVLSNRPDLSPIELKKIIIDTVVHVDRLEGKILSEGRADLFKAIKALP